MTRCSQVPSRVQKKVFQSASLLISLFRRAVVLDLCGGLRLCLDAARRGVEPRYHQRGSVCRSGQLIVRSGGAFWIVVPVCVSPRSGIGGGRAAKLSARARLRVGGKGAPSLSSAGRSWLGRPARFPAPGSGRAARRAAARCLPAAPWRGSRRGGWRPCRPRCGASG
jgi:hypothetical protein